MRLHKDPRSICGQFELEITIVGFKPGTGEQIDQRRGPSAEFDILRMLGKVERNINLLFRGGTQKRKLLVLHGELVVPAILEGRQRVTDFSKRFQVVEQREVGAGNAAQVEAGPQRRV